MSAAPSKLDTAKFRKVHTLMSGGATAGEREAARARAEAMAAKVGMSLKDAVSSLDAPPDPKVHTFDFASWMSERDPKFRTEHDAKMAERRTRADRRRAEVLDRLGSKATVFEPTERERLLAAAIAPLVTRWGSYDDEFGGTIRFAAKVDGLAGDGLIYENLTPAIIKAVRSAYPWPSSLDAALQEVKDWDDLWYDRTLFLDGEWMHATEVTARIEVLKHALERGQPATTWDDVQARFAWKRYEYSSQWIDPHDPVDPFMDRLEADIAALRSQATATDASSSAPRTTAEKRAEVLSMLDAHPELSDREIARRVGASPQTVNTWRKKRSGVAA